MGLQYGSLYLQQTLYTLKHKTPRGKYIKQINNNVLCKYGCLTTFFLFIIIIILFIYLFCYFGFATPVSGIQGSKLKHICMSVTELSLKMRQIFMKIKQN